VLDSKALTKLQSIIFIAIIVVAAVGGAAYVLRNDDNQSSETIKIGILADLDALNGHSMWQGAVLAAEQLNAKGGILGKKVEVVGEDNDGESVEDINVITTALNRLISLHNVDFIIGFAPSQVALAVQDIVANNKIIFIATTGGSDEITQRVLDDYDKCKYYFQIGWNASAMFKGMTDSFALMREQTGFNKIGYIGEDVGFVKALMEGLDYNLP